MKPDGGLSDTMEAETPPDVVPEEYFCQLGMLVLEGRVPEPSLKGRSDGPHCPVAPGDPRPTQHLCDLERSQQCRRAGAMQRQMQTLWKNRIPVCIEVLLLPPCNHGKQAVAHLNVGLPMSSPSRDSCMLLEQWIIQASSRSRDAKMSVKSPRVLFQAVRSYLHFSQLSAWLNLTHGTEPANFGYRISPPGEFCTTKFKDRPEIHTFPVGTVSKSINIKVSVGTLPRLPYIPAPLCREDHEMVQKGDISMLKTHHTESDDREDPDHYSPDTTSPRFTKPRVKSMHELEEGCARRECEQCRHARSPNEHPALPCISQYRHSPSPTPAKHSPPSSEVLSNFSDTGKFKQSPSANTASCTRETGAVPKRQLSRKYPQKPQPDFSDEHALSAPEFDPLPPSQGEGHAQQSQIEQPSHTTAKKKKVPTATLR